MSPSSPPSPLAIPFRFRRKSSSASTSASVDNHIHGHWSTAPSSSPLLSSPPLSTPPCFSGRSKCTEWRGDDYLDDSDWVACDQQGNVDVSYTRPRHTRPEHSISFMHRPFPSPVTKFASHTLWGTALFPYSPSPLSSTSSTTHFCPQGDSVIVDDCKEYDLESMDIHIHETYFATSAERGRWLSSPIAPRVRSHPAPPIHGHSSPVKAPADISPLGERFRRRIRSCTIDDPISTASDDYDEDMRDSSPLPPSSPLTSPLSDLSFLADFDEAVADPCSNPDRSHSSAGTPGMSIPPGTCLSISHSAPTADSALLPALSPCHSGPRHNYPPNDAHVPAPDAARFDSDGILSPLSQFELDLPEVEPSKLPLSDVENKLYPGQHAANPDVTANANQGASGPLCVQFLSINLNHRPLDVPVGAVSERCSEVNAKKRGGVTNGPVTRKNKKRAAIWSGNPSSDTKNGKGGENHTCGHSEPTSKRPKTSRRRDDSATRGPNSHPRHRSKQRCRPRSRPATGCFDEESARTRDDKTPQSATQQPTPVLVDTVDAEFHASLTGMLVEALATSRATSMDSATLCHVLTAAHPHLITERPKQELLADIATVLEAGRVRCGMFEKVDSSGERSRYKGLESRWFYIPERDEDEERASLISAIMPRQKRNETKKYKQYYYRPLDKISRWDPEDAP